jgi:hypothetical protein
VIAKRIFLMVAVLGLAACTADSQKAPAPAGPSGFGMAVTASPDIVVRDGQAQSRIDVALSDASGSSLANRTVHFFVNGGSLSAVSGTTDSSGRVSVTFTAPGPGPTQTVTFKAVLEGTNARTATEGMVSIMVLQPPS